MKKRFKLLALVACLVMLSSCVKNGGEENKQAEQPAKTEETQAKTTGKIEDEPMYGKKIRIGYTGGLCTGAPGIAKVRGEYEKEGIDVEFINVQSPIDAIGSGKIDVLTSHIAELVVPATNGINMTFVSGAQTGCKSLYVMNDGKINSTKDLVGKTVAIPAGVGSSDHNIALRFFNHDKIDPKDIKFKPVETSAVIQAMENGEVGGVILSDQFAEKFVKDNKIKYIRSLTYDDDFKHEPCCMNAFNTNFIKENPQTAAKVAKAIKRTQLWIADNTEEATKVLFDNNWATGDFDQAVRMMKSYDWKVSINDTEKTLRNIYDDYKKFGIISSDKSTDELMEKYWNPLGVDESVALNK